MLTAEVCMVGLMTVFPVEAPSVKPGFPKSSHCLDDCPPSGSVWSGFWWHLEQPAWLPVACFHHIATWDFFKVHLLKRWGHGNLLTVGALGQLLVDTVCHLKSGFCKLSAHLRTEGERYLN